MNSKLKALWQGWVRVSKKIGDFQARLLLSFFYLVLVVPLGLMARLFSDPLAIRKSTANWSPRQTPPHRLEDARRQF